MPLVEKVVASVEMYFGYDIKPVTQDVMALRPELRELSNYLTTMVNAGILTRNESRLEIRYPEHTAEFANDLILPANVAGSAQDPSTGGAPKKNEEPKN